MSGHADNYEAVDMEQSSDSSDNEAFASREDYREYKQHFHPNKVRAQMDETG